MVPSGISQGEGPSADGGYSLAAVKEDLRCDQLPTYGGVSVADNKICLFYFGDHPDSVNEAPTTTRPISIKEDMILEVSTGTSADAIFLN